MANLLVFMELCQGAILPVSLEALGQARRVGTALGATVYALLPIPAAPFHGEDDPIDVCARHGADKVVLLTDEALHATAQMRFDTHGDALIAACEQLRPTVLLFGATLGAREVAARVAARLRATYVAAGGLAAEEGRLVLCDRRGRGLSVIDQDGLLEHPVVVTVPAGRYAPAISEDDAEMVIVAAAAQPGVFHCTGFREHDTTLVLGGDETVSGRLARLLCSEEARAPALILAFGEDLPRDERAVRVAIGPLAEEDTSAHYAFPAPSREAGAAEIIAEIER